MMAKLESPRACVKVVLRIVRSVSFCALKKAVNDVKSIDEIYNDETKTLVINFYNSVARECPYKKSTAFV